MSRKEKTMPTVKNNVLISRWHIEDVLSVDDTLTEKQCIEVLNRVASCFDAEIGINWDVIAHHVKEIKKA